MTAYSAQRELRDAGFKMASTLCVDDSDLSLAPAQQNADVNQDELADLKFTMEQLSLLVPHPLRMSTEAAAKDSYLNLFQRSIACLRQAEEEICKACKADGCVGPEHSGCT